MEAQTKLHSRNLENFGKSKSDIEITFIANTVKNYNVNEKLMTTDTINQTEIKPKIHPKNKWLHPTDEFGILEKGVEFDSKTYAQDIKENEPNTLTII